MKRTWKLTSLALSLAVLFTLSLTGCNGGGTNPASGSKPSTQAPSSTAPENSSTVIAEGKPDTSQEVKLIMYLLGDRTPDFDTVFGKINDKLKAEINATIEAKFMSWGEWEQKYPLVFASGEDFDLIYSADWAMYNAQASKRGFWEITEENLQKYAPLTAETMYPEAWEQAKVEGKVYMLPMNYKELTAYTFLVRGDLMEKYNITEIKDMAGLEQYLDAIAKNEKQLIPIDVGSDFDCRMLFDRFWEPSYMTRIDKLNPMQLMAYVRKDDASVTVFNETEDPEFLNVITKLKDWKDRGFWSKSAVVNTVDNRESFASGKSAAAIMNINDAKSRYGSVNEAHPEWKVQVVDGQGNAPAIIQSYLANGMCIFSKSANPERALIALDLLRNDEELHDLFSYGIEGVHYENAGDGKVKLLDANTNFPYDGNCNWGIRNDAFWKAIEGGIPNYDELYNRWIGTAEAGKFAAFNFNNETVKNQVAAINEIYQSDIKLLYLGFTDDPAADIAKVQQKLKAAGADEVYAEMSKQAKAWLDSLS